MQLVFTKTILEIENTASLHLTVCIALATVTNYILHIKVTITIINSV